MIHPELKKIPRNLQKVLEALEIDSSFKGKDSGYASHNFHAFAAKFPPQLPRLFIENLTNPGETVMDPMVGSGTTVVEALLLGRNGLGFDIDPLAIHISRIKTSMTEYEKVFKHTNQVLARSLNNLHDPKLIQANLASRFDDRTKDFIDYWFNENTQRELMSLILAIEDIRDDYVRSFFKLVFSSIIVTKSGGVSRARDLAHSRPHRDLGKIPKNAIEAFSVRLKKTVGGFHQLPRNNAVIRIEQIDAKDTKINSNTVDLIVTSPPYANAIDYMRAHKFSLVWFGMPISELSQLRSKYIGSERTSDMFDMDLPRLCTRTVSDIVRLDGKKGKIVEKYFIEMKQVLIEMNRVLKHERFCVIVVGNSTMRDYCVKTNECLEEMGSEVGFEVFANIRRELDRDRRMLPASFVKNKAGIENRMHEEFIIILRKQ